MTDNDIIKAFEYYFNKNDGILTVVNNGEQNIITVGDVCKVFNRQKAEIERLQETICIITKTGRFYGTVRAEAIKEFAERLKMKRGDMFPYDTYVDIKHIDNLVKEMVGDV